MKRLRLFGLVVILLFLASCGGGGGNDGGGPSVTSVSPPDGATDVAVDTVITVNFDQYLDNSTITYATFTLSGNQPVSGTLSSSRNYATFTPSSNLDYSTTYTATITTGVTDQSGNNMAADYTWSFTTESTGGSSFTVSLAKTGQTISCEPGDDGDLQMGAAWPIPRFIDNGNGTITDWLTDLMWTQDANAPAPAGCMTALAMTWQDALNYMSCLNTHHYLGYSDWRLPNIVEIESLVDKGRAYNYIWLNLKGFFVNVQKYYYWSSTTNAYDTNKAWMIDMWNGEDVLAGSKSVHYYVWPVRSAAHPTKLRETGQFISYSLGDDGDLQSGVFLPSPRFSNQGGGTMMDNLTGLVWPKDWAGKTGFSGCPSIDVVDEWDPGAFNFIACLNTHFYLGYNDWRLPNRTELWSLVNFGEIDTATWLNNQGFFNVYSGFYWSSTAEAKNLLSHAWLVSLSNGSMLGESLWYDGYNVCPVRAGW